MELEDSESELHEEQEDDEDDENRYDDIFSRPIVHPTAITELSTIIPDEHAIAFPLFHLYTDVKLKDAELFDAFLEGGYCVQLVPVFIHCTSTRLENNFYCLIVFFK